MSENHTRKVWGYASSDIAERYDGACDSREEAIDEGRDEHGDEPFYIIEGEYPDPAKAMPDADRIIEWMGEHAFDNWNDRDGDWPIVSDEAKAELDAFLAAWARKHAAVSFWIGVGDPERVEPAGGGAS